MRPASAACTDDWNDVGGTASCASIVHHHGVAPDPSKAIPLELLPFHFVSRLVWSKRLRSTAISIPHRDSNMAPIGAIWTRIVYVFDFFIGASSPPPLFEDKQVPQFPIGAVQPQATKYPIIVPPDDLEPTPFQCEYPQHPESDGWVACNTNLDRQCWLKNTKTGKRYDINIDYENDGPTGIVREYYVELSNYTRNADGFGDVYVQLFNNSLPGPRIQACWGDQVRITINNTLNGARNPSDPGNGTTVHWHGFRQWKTGQMDGVNGVTQCPIRPGESFTYVFNATQYGTSWYHSHYSLQVCHPLRRIVYVQELMPSTLVRCRRARAVHGVRSDIQEL